MTSMLHFEMAQQRAKKLGITLERSTRKNKKYMFVNPLNGKVVHFGDSRAQDYLMHHNPIRRMNYRLRHSAILNSQGVPAYTVPYSAAWASYYILW